MAGTIQHTAVRERQRTTGLNGVRPRWPEQSARDTALVEAVLDVSMESGLDGRNNIGLSGRVDIPQSVSMESGLDGRNNSGDGKMLASDHGVSMESGLDGRNNSTRRLRQGTTNMWSQWSPA